MWGSGGAVPCASVLAGLGDEVIVTGPALPDDLELVRMVGAAARIAPVGDQLELDVDRVRELITHATKVIVLRSPSLSGEVLTDGVLEQLGALVVERDLRVVAIEGDDALIASGVEQPSIGAVAGLGPRTVTIGGFAAVGLEAWRVGYLAAQREMMGDIRRLKQELSICSPAVSQYAALDAIPLWPGMRRPCVSSSTFAGLLWPARSSTPTSSMLCHKPGSSCSSNRRPECLSGRRSRPQPRPVFSWPTAVASEPTAGCG